jgi:alkylation response protein AidB-like acyl-CoA dehydrogenase
MDFDFSGDEQAYRAEVRAFLAEVLPVDWQGITTAGDEAWKFSLTICKQLAERGWLTQAWPEDFGGSGASIWRQAVLQEELWAHSEPRGSQYMNFNWIGPAIIHFGRDDQKARFLKRIAAGDILWCQGFSEPESGSDLASLRTLAQPVEGGFLVNGQKIWISYGDIADFCVALVRTDPASRRKSGLSVLLVDLTLPGVEVRPIDGVFGPHRQSEIIFTEAFVPADALLGDLNDGWQVANTALSFERSGSARYARSARVVGALERELGDDDRLRHEMAEVMAFARVTELMNYRVMEMKERGEVPGWESSAARIHNALLEQGIADLSEEVLGVQTMLGAADPFTVQYGDVEALWRNAPAATVTAGSFEIQTGIVARKGLGLDGAR